MDKYIGKQFFTEDGCCIWCKAYDEKTNLYECDQEYFEYGGEDGETLLMDIIHVHYTAKALSEMRKAEELPEFLDY